MKNNLKMVFDLLKFPLLVFLLNVILILLNAFESNPWLDIPLHILGGAAIATSSLILLKVLQQKNQLGKMNPLIIFLFVISLVALAAVVWELAEFTSDLFYAWGLQESLPDTMLDLTLGILGGMGVFLFKRKER